VQRELAVTLHPRGDVVVRVAKHQPRHPADHCGSNRRASHLVGDGARAAMQPAVHPRDQVCDATTVTVFFGCQEQIFKGLGARTDGNRTLFELAAENPEMLKKWAASRASGQAAMERRAFAKMALGIIEGGFCLGYHVKPPPSSASAPAASTAAGPGQRAGPPRLAQDPVTLTRQRGVRAVSRIATVPATQSVIRTAGRHMLWLWTWAPIMVTVFVAFVGLLVLRNPDVLVFIPAKLLSWGWCYLWYIGSKILARVERELSTWFHTTLHQGGQPLAIAPPGENPLVPAAFGQPLGPVPSVSFLGWLVAIVLYNRQ